jgi:hypothetical protein
MRCMSCGAEMRVLRVERDDTQDFAGYERQTLECTACHDVETRTVFRETAAAPPVAPVPHHAAPPTSASPPLDNEVDDGEELLRRAIEMVRGPLRSVQPAKTSTEPAPAASAASATAAEAELDEGEAMLRRAIDMVRSATHGARPSNGLADLGIAPPADQAKAMPAKRSPPSRVVRICHDPSFDAAYAAKDATSGLVVIRHQDSGRLRAMCDRLGWQVIESEPPGAGV